MFFKVQKCCNCKIGKESYELDKHSASCPYINCWQNGKCIHFQPIDKPKKRGLFRRNKTK